VSLLIRFIPIAFVAEVLFGHFRPPVWGAWTIIAAVTWLAIESAAWNRVWDTRVQKSPSEAEDDNIRKAASRYDRPGIGKV